MSTDLILKVVSAYPQVFHACHLEHPRARTNPGRVSARDAWILGHLDVSRPMSPGVLARHLSLGAPTVSESVRRLERLGYVIRRRSPGDHRRLELLLSPRGAEAMRGATVLDPDRVGRLLGQLSPRERNAAVRGLLLLAKGARSLNAKAPKRWPAAT